MKDSFLCRTCPVIGKRQEQILLPFFTDQNCCKRVATQFKGLKAPIEQQDDGAGMLHQVAQFPIDQVCLYTRFLCPSPPMQDPERQGTGCKAGRPIRPFEPPPFAQRGSCNV